jgi:creatinine amidohydrolase
MTWEEAQALARPGTVVVIPTGSIEQHGKHLPVEVDSRLVSEVAAQAVQVAGRKIDVILTPTLSYGASYHHIEFPGTMSLALPTYIQVLNELAESLIVNHFTHILFLNGHGGNSDPVRISVRMLRDKHEDVVAAGACYWDLARDEINKLRRSPPGGLNHGCELEAAMMMHLRPELVRKDKIIRHVPEWSTEYLLPYDLIFGEKTTWGHHITDISTTGVIGDPTLSTPEHGGEFFLAITDAVAAFLTDFSGWNMKKLVKNR